MSTHRRWGESAAATPAARIGSDSEIAMIDVVREVVRIVGATVAITFRPLLSGRCRRTIRARGGRIPTPRASGLAHIGTQSRPAPAS
ncbi:hypothetical protein [Burkholderia pyrrocinia]|uniref:hypothetical protein n=1 Tax=Burkholderia pyrrocinia TaxID=60550 RepID=UPI00201B7A0F|nr:hypothetical protein [Burkholderia pyrrocinia]